MRVGRKELKLTSHRWTYVAAEPTERDERMVSEAMTENRPLLDTIMDMTAASVERADLDGRELLMVRLAALAAVGSPVSSYLLSVAAAEDTALTLEDARSVLIAIAPIVGAPKVVEAAGSITEALGIALALEDLIAEQDAGRS